MHQGFGGNWNLKNQNGFDAIGEQLNLFEGQKTCGQRHDSPLGSYEVATAFRTSPAARPERTGKLMSSASEHNAIKCQFVNLA